MNDLSSPELPARSNEPDPNFIRWLRQNCVPIVLLILSGLLLCLVGHYSSITVDWSKTKDFTDAFSNAIQGLGLIAGGIWAYFKFVKGRTFQERLIPSVSGKFALIDGFTFLIVTMQIKNIGSSNVVFDQEMSVLIVSEYHSVETKEVVAVAGNRLTSFQVFADKDRYLEPNEIMKRQRLLALPGFMKTAYQLEFVVRSDSGYIWRTMTIVNKSTLSDNHIEQLFRLEEGSGINDN